MKRAYGWFKKLSNVAKVSMLGTLALGGYFVTSATSSPPAISAPVITTKTETITQPVPFQNKNIDDNSLNKGATRVQTVGIDGIKTITYTITLADEIETSRTSSETITLTPTDQITAVGTYVKPVPSCDQNYSGCVPIVSYDLDCGDIGFQVRILGYDPHGFDRDNDGYGCESY